MFFFCKFKRQFFSVNIFFYYIFCNIESRSCHIIITSSLAGVDLEETVFAITPVILDIKVGESYIVQIFQQILHLHHQLFVWLCDDNCMISKSVWCVFFQEYMSQTHHFNFSIPVRIRSQNTHIFIISRNHILDNQFICITCPIDIPNYFFQFFSVLDRVDLILGCKRMLPVRNTVRRL